MINHIAIWTNDLELLKDFYLKYFDCTANAKYTNSTTQFSSYFISFTKGARIELMQRPDIYKTNNETFLGYAHIAINVGTREYVDALTTHLEQDGYKTMSYPRVTGDDYYESVICDPENNRIELVAG